MLKLPVLVGDAASAMITQSASRPLNDLIVENQITFPAIQSGSESSSPRIGMSRTANNLASALNGEVERQGERMAIRAGEKPSSRSFDTRSRTALPRWLGSGNGLRTSGAEPSGDELKG